MSKITPCLWFNRDAETATAFYVSLVADSRIDRVFRSPVDWPNGKAGDVLTVEFTLGGLGCLAMNGGPEFTFNPAVSLQIHCDDQAEVDRIWQSILADGGAEMACGWIRDRWGFAWQIVPRRLTELLQDADPARAQRAMTAMMGMIKIDLAALERAAG